MLATNRSQPSRKAAILGGFALLLLTGPNVAVGSANAQTPAPACKKALADATARWPKRNKAADGIMGDAAHKKRKSDHNLGNAFDLTHDPANGVDCNVLAKQLINDRRVTYVIWNRQIYDRRRPGEGWRNIPAPTRTPSTCTSPSSRSRATTCPHGPVLRGRASTARRRPPARR